MKITNISVTICAIEGNRIKAGVDILIDNCFAVKNIRIIESKKSGYFVAMPSFRANTENFEDIVYPINQKTRDIFTSSILGKFYQEVINLVNSIKITKGYDLKINLKNIHDIALVDISNNKIIDTYDVEDFKSETLEELEIEVANKISEVEFEEVEANE